MSHSLSIHFGPFAIAFISPAPSIINHLNIFFSGYACTRAPDCTIHIIPSEAMPHPVRQIQKEWLPLRGDETSFEMGPDIVKGSLDPDHNAITITVHPDVFLPELLRVFHSFLYRVYHTLCKQKKLTSCFIHGCGVVDTNTGYLFIGPHQSGKTTIGTTSQGTIIHDDQILLTLTDSGITIDSPPLPARDNLRCRPEKPCCIERIFVICKDTTFALRPLEQEKALSTLYSEIVLPLTLRSSDDNKARAQKAGLCFAIVKRLPVLALHFDREGSFWKNLKGLQRR
jgi:hypothetical protein